MMSANLLHRLCVRTSLLVDGERENQGSGFIIKDKDDFYVVTAHHCIYGGDGEYQDITPDDILIEHQKENYRSPFTPIKVEDIVSRNEQEDWTLLRIADPNLTIDFSRIKLGIPRQEDIDVKFCGYQQASPDSYRPFDAELLSLAPKQFRITLKDKSFSQGSEEGSFIAKGLSGSGLGVESNDILYFIGLLKSVIGNEALNDDIECCSISCLSTSLKEPMNNLPQIIHPRLLAPESQKLLGQLEHLASIIENSQSKVEPLSVQRLDPSCRIQFVPGNSCIIELPGNQYGIIDCDRKAARRVLGYLEFRNIKSLRFIAISHWHFDHYSGFQKILDSVDKIDYAFIPDPKLLQDPRELNKRNVATAASRMFSELEQRHNKQELSLFNTSGGINKYDFAIYTDLKESISLTSFAPFVSLDGPPYRGSRLRQVDQNRFSTIYQVQVGRYSFLITGDITIDGWEELFQYAAASEIDIRADGMILPHHGSHLGINEHVLQRLKKEDKIYTLVEPNSRWHFPRENVLEMVKNEGGQVEVYENTISILMNLEGIRVIGEI